MKVYSDTLTRKDLAEAAHAAGVYLWLCEEMKRTRVRAHGWEVSLSGSSPYRSQMADYHQAATYDEHGEWMMRLFDLDPDARISWWKDRADFMRGTEGKYAAVSR